MEPSRPLLLTTEQVARQLNCSVRSVKKMIATGKLPSLRIGGSRRIQLIELERWVAEQAVEATAEPQDTKAA